MNFHFDLEIGDYLRLPPRGKNWINFLIEFVPQTQQSNFQNDFHSLSIFEYIKTGSLYLQVKMVVLWHSVQYQKLGEIFFGNANKK